MQTIPCVVFTISLDETKEELEEFQISSQELEQELETQLEQAERKVRDFTAANQRLQAECESLKVCYLSVYWNLYNYATV